MKKIFFVIILIFLFLSCKQQKQMLTDEDKAMLLTIEDFKNAGVIDNIDENVLPEYEKSKKVLKSWFLRYTLSFAFEGEIPVIIYEKITFEDSVNTAKKTYIGIEKNFLAKFISNTSTMVETEIPLNWGDETKFYTIFSGGKKVGNVILVRIDKKIFQIYFSGFYFNSPSDFEYLIKPKLELLKNYRY